MTVKSPVGAYTGDFVNGKRHGHGLFKYVNGDSYEGEWKHNLKNGDGIFTDADGKIFSQGLFKDGKLFTGTGRIFTNHGSIYEGEVLEGQRHGQGKLTSKTGLVWEGEFRNNEPFNGKGWFDNKQGVWAEGVLTADKKKKTTKTAYSSDATTFPSDLALVKKEGRKRAVKRAVKPEEEVEEEEVESEWGMKY